MLSGFERPLPDFAVEPREPHRVLDSLPGRIRSRFSGTRAFDPLAKAFDVRYEDEQAVRCSLNDQVIRFLLDFPPFFFTSLSHLPSG